MSSIYSESTHPKLSAVSDVLNSLIELAYVPSDEDKGTMAEARLLGDKELAIKKIKELGSSAEHKLELLNFKLQIIKTFDWIKTEEFKQAPNQLQATSVTYSLQDGKMSITFFYKETVVNFIHTEISSFFSTATSIIDNISEIVYYAFRINLKGDKLIYRVVEKMKDGELKQYLRSSFCNNYSFYGMRDIRNAYAHNDHRGIIKIDHVSTRDLIGDDGKEVIVARIDSSLIEGGIPLELANIPNGDRIDNYCIFLYKKIIEALEGFVLQIEKLK
jgi:hypothetical protein